MENNPEITADQIDTLVGANLKRMRLEREITLKALADHIGVSYQQIGNYEAGIHRLSVGTLHRIAQYLCVNIGDFYDGVDTLIETGEVEIKMPNPNEKALLIYYRKIGKINQHHVFNIIRSLADHISVPRDTGAGPA